MTLPPMPPFPQLHWFVDEWTDKALWAYHTPEQLRTYAEQYGRLCIEAGRQSLAIDTIKMAEEHKQRYQSELDRLQARVAELEVDAERLDWLDKHRESIWTHWTNHAIGIPPEFHGFSVNSDDRPQPTVRAAIDTARKAKP